MPIRIGNNANQDTIYVGNTSMAKVYIGDKLVWQKVSETEYDIVTWNIFPIGEVGYLGVEFDFLTEEQQTAIAMDMDDGNIIYFEDKYTGVDDYNYTILNAYYDVRLYSTVEIAKSKIIGFEMYDPHFIGTILDLSDYTQLSYLFFQNYNYPNYTVESLIFPNSVHSAWGMYCGISGLHALISLTIPAWDTTSGSWLYIYECDSLASITFEENVINAIGIGYCPLLTTVDLSDIELGGSNPMIDLNNNESLTTVILPPANIPIKTLTLDDNGSLGYINLSSRTELLKITSGNYDFSGNNLTAAEVNHYLVDLDSIATSGYSYRRIDIAGNNAPPDNSSGGYDGLAAKASLQGKGFTVIVSS